MARPMISILLLVAVAQIKELRIDLLVRGIDSGSANYLPKLEDGNGSQEGILDLLNRWPTTGSLFGKRSAHAR